MNRCFLRALYPTLSIARVMHSLKISILTIEFEKCKLDAHTVFFSLTIKLFPSFDNRCVNV